MTTEILNFLKNYTDNTFKINRLIITSFLNSNKIIIVKNDFIKNHFIKVGDVDYDKSIEFNNLLKQKLDKIAIETLLELFEFVISPADKIINGAVYTPAKIRTYIIAECFKNITSEQYEKVLIGDISCGCGGFLIDAALKVNKAIGKNFNRIFSENLFGLDIKNYSIERTKILLSLLAISNGEDKKEFTFNLYTGNALSFEWLKIHSININNGFDIILGNPPYVCSRNIDEQSKLLLAKWSATLTGHPDLYIPFFQIGYENLRINGILGYITVNSFFKSVNGRAIREYIQKEKIDLTIIDFGGEQIFKSRLAYTCLCFLKKKPSEYIRYIKKESKDLINNIEKYICINYNSLESNHGWNLLKKEIIEKIENTGRQFGELYKTSNGIATLKNDVFVFKPLRENSKYYFLDKDIKIEKNVCKDIINPNKFISISNIDLIKKKIIFPYKYENGKAKLLKENELKEKYPKTFSYLESKREVLASRDKNKCNYEKWYAYGRNQSLDKMKYKLFFPHITPHTPNFIISKDENLLFVNGIAVISDRLNELQFLKTIMGSRLFWFYIENTSKNYSSGYFSLSRNYIKSFGIYSFDENEKEYLVKIKNKDTINSFIEYKYGIKIK